MFHIPYPSIHALITNVMNFFCATFNIPKDQHSRYYATISKLVVGHEQVDVES